MGDHIAGYRVTQKSAGETGGKNFVLAHPSADTSSVGLNCIGAFEYQGQSALRRRVPIFPKVCGRAEGLTRSDDQLPLDGRREPTSPTL